MILRKVVSFMAGVIFVVLMSHAAVACSSDGDCGDGQHCCSTANGQGGCFPNAISC